MLLGLYNIMGIMFACGAFANGHALFAILIIAVMLFTNIRTLH